MDTLADEQNVSWKAGRGEYLYGRHSTPDFTLVKPLTYMNNSGAAVRILAEQEGAGYDQMLIVYDDLDLPLGKMRFRPGGSAGTHKGMRSVVNRTGTREIPRLRLGIGSERQQSPAEEFVLSPFSKDELPIAREMVNHAITGVMTLIDEGIDVAMNTYNHRDFTGD